MSFRDNLLVHIPQLKALRSASETFVTWLQWVAFRRKNVNFMTNFVA